MHWDQVCLSLKKKKKKGLGIRNLNLLNMSLLTKWIWKFTLEKNVAWRNYIEVKYGVGEDGWFPKNFRRSHGVGLWKSISKELECFKLNNKLKLGDDTKIRFWEDY